MELALVSIPCYTIFQALGRSSKNNLSGSGLQRERENIMSVRRRRVQVFEQTEKNQSIVDRICQQIGRQAKARKHLDREKLRRPTRWHYSTVTVNSHRS